MAIGRSGRVVVELEPELKSRLHARLRSEGRDFKGWLLERIEQYLGASQDSEEPASNLSDLERRVFDAVSSDAHAHHHVDDLACATGLAVAEIREALLRLELRGRVVQHLGFYQLVRPS